MPFNKIIAVGLLAFLSSASVHALELQLRDAKLQQCIMALAQKKNWQSPADITDIECHSLGITSIEGLETFTQLQKLSLYNNQLTAVTIAHLPKLKHINLAKNKLTVINLQDLPALEELYIFSNKLPSIELVNLPAMTLLKINDNQLTQLTYKALPALEKMYLFNNHVEDIDIYHLPNLKYMDARQNPMPDKLYEDMDKLTGVTFLHDGNAEDWQ